MKALSLLLLLCTLLSGCQSTAKLEVVSNFNAERYMGTWYEAARYPHRFEKDLSSVSAQYTMNPNGKIRVVNSGFNDTEKAWKDIEGVAKFKGATDTGWLKVSFFKPFYASYKIIHINDEYTEAIVAGPSYNYLWILVRDPLLPKSQLDQLIAKAEGFGFDRSKLQVIDQSLNRDP
jgi:apolipoprotein D and lipocalin family protein